MKDRFLTDEDDKLPPSWNRKAKFHARLRLRRGWVDSPNDPHWAGGGLRGRHDSTCEVSFRCAHCGQDVTGDPRFSGVNHRNHCPYCLWSRHLDLWVSGDRLAACKALMRPVGLSCKWARNKYGPPRPGELLLIHECLECGKFSLNRLAADDMVETALSVYTASLTATARLQPQLNEAGIRLLGAADAGLVRLRLLGCTALSPG